MKGKTTPRQMWVPIAIHRYQGLNAWEIQDLTGIKRDTVHNILKKKEYHVVEERIFAALDMEQLNAHTLVKHASSDIDTGKSDIKSDETSEEIPVDVDTQM